MLDSQQSPLRVLLAEDDRVNQFVVVRLLKKRGHVVHVVPNGQLALEAVQRKHFDVVLMDIQMPVLDGYTCVAELRRLELGSGNHLPVIAMTANSSPGDRERCLASGMDDYLSKPVRDEDLAVAIGRVIPVPTLSDESMKPFPAVIPEQQLPSACDLKAAVKTLNGDQDFLRQLIRLFLDTVPERLDSLRSAIHRGHPELISDEAHSIKGSVRYFQAEKAYEAALRLEIVGRSGDVKAIDQSYSELLHEMERLREELLNALVSADSSRQLSLSGSRIGVSF